MLKFTWSKKKNLSPPKNTKHQRGYMNFNVQKECREP